MMASAVDESWELLLSLFPHGWEQQAVLSGAVERLRGFDSVGQLLRVLLLHVGKGYSLRETAARAKQAGLVEVSDVTLLNRLREAEPWWHWLCSALLAESGWHMSADTRGFNVRRWMEAWSMSRAGGVRCGGFTIACAFPASNAITWN